MLGRHAKPSLVLDYAAANVWRSPSGVPFARPHYNFDVGPALQNHGLADAHHVRISDLILDGAERYRFRTIIRIRAGYREPIDLVARAAEANGVIGMPVDLARVISRHLVRSVLDGQPPSANWPVTIAYEDWRGRTYVTACEIQALMLPLHLEALNAIVGMRVNPKTGKSNP